jgi:hypothetical protein
MPEAVDHAFLHPLFLPDLLNDCIIQYLGVHELSLHPHFQPLPVHLHV